MAARFTVDVGAESFTVAVTSPATADLMREALRTGRVGVITGELRAGDGGFNLGHAWHVAPDTVELPDVAMELCDGRPSDVDRDLHYWIDTVGRFCPWTCKVVAEDH